MDGIDTSKLKVSLEPHLLKILKPLPGLLPLALAEELKIYVSDVSKDIIPYSTLLAVSQWSRTSEGRERLETCTLNPNNYMMVSLLAGVKTSPERNFGAYVSLPEPEQLAQQQKRERQEITTIIDGLLSVFCVGFATWWASDKLHWQNHWVRTLALQPHLQLTTSQRVLLALGTTIIVALAETGLLIIWRSRQSTSSARRKRHSKMQTVSHKKTDGGDEKANETKINIEAQFSEQKKLSAGSLRQRWVQMEKA